MDFFQCRKGGLSGPILRILMLNFDDFWRIWEFENSDLVHSQMQKRWVVWSNPKNFNAKFNDFWGIWELKKFENFQKIVRFGIYPNAESSPQSCMKFVENVLFLLGVIRTTCAVAWYGRMSPWSGFASLWSFDIAILSDAVAGPVRCPSSNSDVSAFFPAESPFSPVYKILPRYRRRDPVVACIAVPSMSFQNAVSWNA